MFTEKSLKPSEFAYTNDLLPLRKTHCVLTIPVSLCSLFSTACSLTKSYKEVMWLSVLCNSSCFLSRENFPKTASLSSLTPLPLHSLKPSSWPKLREDFSYYPWQRNSPLWLWFELQLFWVQGSHVNLLCFLANVSE